jgi:hypothetical protein
MHRALVVLMMLLGTSALAGPRLLESESNARAGWLLAAADPEVVVTTTDGQVVSGTLIEDVAGGVMVRTKSGEQIFIERARVKNLAHTLGEAGTRSDPVIGDPAVGRTKESLKAELAKLLAERPGAGGGITMIVLGGLGLIVGVVSMLPALILLNTGYATSQNIGVAFLISGLIEIVVGAILLITGIVVTKEVGARRRLYNEKIQSIETELKRLDDVERGRTQRPPDALIPTQLAAFSRGI